jgi:cytochrome c-type biogenesis protein CcmH
MGGEFMKKFVWVLIFALAVAALRAGTASAQQPTPSDDEVNAIARLLYCPVCENTPLDVCPTQACAQWRDLIREKLAAGWSDEQIKQYFVDQYGARVLAEPPRQGLNWLVYIIPPLVFLIGAVILFRAFRAWRISTDAGAASTAASGSDGPSAPQSGSVSDADYVARLEEELRKRK